MSLASIVQTCKDAFSFDDTIRLGGNVYKDIYIPGSQASYIMCDQVLLEVYHPHPGPMSNAIADMIKRAQETHHPVISDLMDHLVVVGPQSSVEEGMDAYKINHQDVRAAFGAYSKTLNWVAPQPAPDRPKDATPGQGPN